MATAEHLPDCTEDTREVHPCPGGEQGCNPVENRPEWERLAEEAERFLGIGASVAPDPAYEEEGLW
jgi:hypothetical protein